MTLALVDYPADFPCPDRDSFAMELGAGLYRDPAESSAPNQRRANANCPVMITATFRMPVALLFKWQTWVNAKGYLWFNIDIAHPFTGNLTEKVAVRFASDTLQFNYDNFGTVTVAAQLELHPAVFAESAL